MTMSQFKLSRNVEILNRVLFITKYQLYQLFNNRWSWKCIYIFKINGYWIEQWIPCCIIQRWKRLR